MVTLDTQQVGQAFAGVLRHRGAVHALDELRHRMIEPGEHGLPGGQCLRPCARQRGSS